MLPAPWAKKQLPWQAAQPAATATAMKAAAGAAAGTQDLQHQTPANYNKLAVLQGGLQT
jgi:surface antigen